VRWRWLWHPIGVLSPLPTTKWRVDHDDDELVDIVVPLFHC
jgi:hypothetical protein